MRSDRASLSLPGRGGPEPRVEVPDLPGRELEIEAADGVPITATLYDAGEARHLALINPAMGVRRGFYAPFARYLAGRGVAALTFDYRGLGGTPLPASGARMQDWGELDLQAAIAWAAAERPGARLVAVGHSAGGQLLGLAPDAGRVSCLLGVASQSGYWGHWDGWRAGVLSALWHVVMPGVTRLLGRFPGSRLGLSDLPGGVALQWAEWCRHPEYLLGRLPPERTEGYAAWDGRLLAWAFSDDGYASPAAVRALLDFYPSARREYRETAPDDLGVEEIGHWGFFRDPACRALWPEAFRWLTEEETGAEGTSGEDEPHAAEARGQDAGAHGASR